MVKKTSDRFVYRDSVWHGTDMIGAGVASFSHMSGVHFQNFADWNEYLGSLASGKLPLSRAYKTSASERMVREMILQLKLGEIDPNYFKNKFSRNILSEFRTTFEDLQKQGFIEKLQTDQIVLSRSGLLRVDQLLSEFYDAAFRNSRYT
jgi:oxygen-independent coproporphyrinogen-3 oxidase